MIKEGGKRINNPAESAKDKVPVLSIITVVLNGEECLEKTIQSVVSQLNDTIEYIIIDGGSTDGSLDIIKSYDNIIDYWISEPDNGISDAFNKGIKLSRGEIIGIINSDDWYETGSFEKIIKEYKIKNADVFCGAVKFWENEKPVVVSFPDIRKLKRETSVHHAAVFIKRSAYTKHGTYNTDYRYAMDYELLLRFMMNGAEFKMLNEVIANRRLEGLSYTNKNKALHETLKIRKGYFSILNVYSNFVYVWIKDTLGRLIKNMNFISIYRFYWRKKNETLAKELNK